MSSEEIFAKVYGSSPSSTTEDIFAKVYGEEKPLESRTKRPGAGGKAFLRGAFKVAKEAAKLRPEHVLMPRKTSLGEDVLTEKVQEQIGDPEAGFGEKVIERGTEILPYLLGGEGALLGKLGRAGLTALAGQTAKEAELGPTGEFLAEALALGAPGLGKKIVPRKSQQELVDLLRKKGVSEQEIAPLIPSKGKAKILGPLAKKTEKARERISKTKEALGRTREGVIEGTQGSPILESSTANTLKNDLLKITKDFPADIKKNINASLEESFRKPVTFDSLADIWIKDINKEIYGKQISNKKAIMNKLKPLLMDNMKKINPQAAKEFELVQGAFDNIYKNVGKQFKPNILEKLINLGKIRTVLIPIVTGSFTGIKGALATEGTRRVMTELLINPRLQNLTAQMLKALDSNKIALAKKLEDRFISHLQKKGISEVEEESVEPQTAQ